MPPNPQVSPRERRWVVGWSIVILVLSCIPYLIATQAAPAGWQFAGVLVNPLDTHSYLAKIQHGLQGNWLFHLTYTSEPHTGTLIYLFYLALGHVAALTHLPVIRIFHLARLAAGFWLLLVGYHFIAHITPNLTERRLAFVFLFSASGLSWLGVLFGAFPIDLWVPEAFVPYAIYTNPHFPLGMALMLIIFLQVVGSAEEISESANSRIENKKLSSTPQSAIRAGFAALALALVSPFAVLTVWAVLAVYIGWLYLAYRRLPWKQIWPTLGVGLFSAPVIIYYYWVSTTHPIVRGWSAQNITAAPTLLNFGLGYGLIGLLAGLGGWQIVRRGKNPAEWLVLLWAITTIGLVYTPFDLQRRLITGLHIPLCILAAIGLMRWLNHRRLRPGRRRLLIRGAVGLGVWGTLFVWLFPLAGIFQSPVKSETSALFFLRNEEVAALTWLRQNTDSNDIILASPRLGMFIPGQTGARVFYGHPFETIEAETKKAQVEAFYRGEIDMVSLPVDFIIYGPSEQAIGQPATLSDYEVVFTTDDISIYKVTGQ